MKTSANCATFPRISARNGQGAVRLPPELRLGKPKISPRGIAKVAPPTFAPLPRYGLERAQGKNNHHALPACPPADTCVPAGGFPGAGGLRPGRRKRLPCRLLCGQPARHRL